MDNTNMEQIQPTNPELENKNQSPYEQSKIVDALLHSGVKRIAFVDIDSTFTGTPEDQKAAYDALINANYQLVYVTSRTPEMTISSEAAKKSPEFSRPAPKLQNIETTKTDGTIDAIRDSGAKFSTAYPDQVMQQLSEEKIAEGVEPLSLFVGIHNAHATLAGTGSEIWIQQQDGSYRLDKNYEEGLHVNRATWRQETTAKINAVNAEVGNTAKYAPIEDINNYHQGNVDVAPPDLRVQLNFSNLDAQLAYMEKMRATHPEIRVIEDGNPEHGRFQVYLTPAGAGKEQAVEQFFQQTLSTMNAKLPQEQQVQPQDVETLFIGDSWPDVPMGLLGAKGSKATLLLVGGSRITPLVGDQRNEHSSFASEVFTGINDKIIPQQEQGHYKYEDRTIVTGEAFPNTRAPQTITAFIESQK